LNARENHTFDGCSPELTAQIDGNLPHPPFELLHLT